MYTALAGSEIVPNLAAPMHSSVTRSSRIIGACAALIDTPNESESAGVGGCGHVARRAALSARQRSASCIA